MPGASTPAEGTEALADDGLTGGAAAWLCAVLTVIAALAALAVLLLRRRRQVAGAPDIE